MKPLFPIREALADPHILGGLLDGPTWAHWRTLLIAAMGEPLDDGERVLFEAITGRPAEPGEMVEELWAPIGRRGGKTRAISVASAYLAACVDWRDVLAPGELGVLAILAASVRQAEVALSYTSAIFGDKTRPLLHHLWKGETAETIELKTGIVIEVRPASFKTIRSITAIGIVCDEIAFWSSGDSINPDVEILAAARPALLTTGGPLIAISSPHAKRGELWTNYKAHFGAAGDPRILVANAPSKVMNPSLPQREIDRAFERDAARASAEYGGRFRDDIEDYIGPELIEAATIVGRDENPPVKGLAYVAFADPSGGTSDSFTLAIAHKENDKVVLDCTREIRPPFSSDLAVEDMARVLKLYGLREVIGDRYASVWVPDRFKAHEIEYKHSELTKSEIYKAALPLFTSKRVELLDNPRLASQFCALERRVSRGGRDTVDHPVGAHDDVANAVAGALALADSHAPMEWTAASLAGIASIVGAIGGSVHQERMFFDPTYARGRGGW